VRDIPAAQLDEEVLIRAALGETTAARAESVPA